jgi:hypothetical protein
MVQVVHQLRQNADRNPERNVAANQDVLPKLQQQLVQSEVQNLDRNVLKNVVDLRLLQRKPEGKEEDHPVPRRKQLQPNQLVNEEGGLVSPHLQEVRLQPDFIIC